MPPPFPAPKHYKQIIDGTAEEQKEVVEEPPAKKKKSKEKKHTFALEYVDIVYDLEKEMLMHSTDFSKTNINSQKDKEKLDILNRAFDSEIND